jgi:hypothetical protein
LEFPHTALSLCQGQPKDCYTSESTYLEFSKTKVANFDCEIFADKNVVTFDVAMNNTQGVHILEDASSVKGNL